MRTIHSSSSSFGRALRAANEPTMPALYLAMDSSGTETMNIGAPIRGSDRRFCRRGGSGMEFVFTRLLGLLSDTFSASGAPGVDHDLCRILRFDAVALVAQHGA